MDDDLETTEEAFDLIPEEVQQYVYGENFNKSLTELLAAIGLDTDKQQSFKGGVFEYIAQISTKEDLDEMIKEMVPDQTNRQKVQAWVDTYVVDNILSILDQQITIDVYEEKDEEQTEAPRAATPPSSLAERLKQASIASSAKREYTGTEENPAAISEEAPRTIDPYHEPIDNV